MPNSPYLRDLVLRRTLLDRELFPSLFMSLHSGEPDEHGSEELPDYSRQQVILGRSAPGSVVNQNTLDFNMLPNANVGGFGIWDAERDGHFLIGGALPFPQRVGPNTTISALRWQISELVLRFE